MGAAQTIKKSYFTILCFRCQPWSHRTQWVACWVWVLLWSDCFCLPFLLFGMRMLALCHCALGLCSLAFVVLVLVLDLLLQGFTARNLPGISEDIWTLKKVTVETLEKGLYYLGLYTRYLHCARQNYELAIVFMLRQMWVKKVSLDVKLTMSDVSWLRWHSTSVALDSHVRLAAHTSDMSGWVMEASPGGLCQVLQPCFPALFPCFASQKQEVNTCAPPFPSAMILCLEPANHGPNETTSRVKFPFFLCECWVLFHYSRSSD